MAPKNGLVTLLMVVTCKIFSVHSAVDITNKAYYCSEANGGVHLSPDVVVTLICDVDNLGADPGDNILRWAVPSGGDEFITLSSSGISGNNDLFTAQLISVNDTTQNISSNLTFVTSKDLDNKLIECRDSVPGPNAMCTLLILTRSSAPIEVSNISATYQSVSFSWSSPSDTGGCNIVNYIITVTPLDDSYPWNITTTNNSTSYNVTELKFQQSYNFTVRGNNCLGVGEESNTVTVTLPGEVPPPVITSICLNYNANNMTELNVSWTESCPPVITNIDTTPPVVNYTILISGIPGYLANVTTCSHSQSVSEGMYTANVTANNIVGSSKKTSVDFNARWLQNVNYKNVDTTKLQAEVIYTTVVCIQQNNLDVLLVYNNDTTNVLATDTKLYVANTTDSFILSSLQPGATISYTLQVIDTDGNTVGSANTGSFMFTSSPSSSLTPTSTLSILVTTTITTSSVMTITITTITSDTTTATTTPSKESSAIPWAAVGGGIAAVFLFVLVIIITLLVIGYVYYKKKNRHNVNFGKGGGRKDSDGPIALVETKSAVPETGQALYQNPTTIERQQAPTGDLYAMPDKGKGKGSRRQVPTTPSAENATYQDPATIEHQQAPTGALYAMPEKKPKYSEVQKQNTGVLYADVEIGKASSDQPRGKLSEVLYSDVKS